MRLMIVLIDSVLLVVRTLFAVLWAEMVSRTIGPLALRFLLPPLMAFALAVCEVVRVSRLSRWMHQARRGRERSAL
jgi:hypothetical protein